MPTSKELVSNKPLVGSDLAEIVISDLRSVLANDSFFTPFIAYARCAVEVRVTLHMDNPSSPKTVSVSRTKAAADDAVDAREELGSLEPFPLAAPTSDDSVLQSTTRSRDIPSANAARVAFGIPIDVVTRDNDGQSTERKVLYPADYPGSELPDPIDTDTTAIVRSELGMPPEEPPTPLPSPTESQL